MLIVHLLMDEKFTPEFISYVNSEFNQDNNHIFMILTSHVQLRYKLDFSKAIILIKRDFNSLIKLTTYLLKADKIFVHGLFIRPLVYLIFILNIAQKVIWGIWGGDLYNYKNEKGLYAFVKKSIVSKFHGAATYIPGDIDLARKVYGFSGKYYQFLCYISNVIEDENMINKKRKPDKPYTILVGNSADDENRHLYILEKLKSLDLKDSKIIIPLSYGEQGYADKVQMAYEMEYDNKVVCLREFMQKSDYLNMLSDVDVVLFAHKRQQGMGNLIHLIAMGAKVYMEPDITSYEWLVNLGITVFNIETVDNNVMIPLNDREKANNKEIMCSFASRDNYNNQFRAIFG